VDVGYRLAGIALIPVSIEGLGCEAELDNEIGGEVFGLDLPALFSPEAHKGVFIPGP